MHNQNNIHETAFPDSLLDGFEEDIKACPQCGSENIEYGIGEGVSKLKPWASCGDCKQLLAWG